MYILPFVQNDPYLKPFAKPFMEDMSMLEVEKQLLTESHSLSNLLPAICISAYIVLLTDGYSENGHPMQLPFI